MADVALPWPRVVAEIEARIEANRTALESAPAAHVERLQGDIAACRAILSLPTTLVDDPATRLEPDRAGY